MTRAAVYRMTIEQGATYDQTFLFKNKETGEPLDFTGYASRMQMRTAYDAEYPTISLDEGDGMTTGGVAGTIRVQMTPAQTAAIAAGEYVYDVEIYSYEDADVQRMLQGVSIVTPEATRP